ncbi:MAG: hypothetical protein HY323_07285 [Betaproteobacteria bacterium]|nr:hypothetical protein [Betaproteobacteria bacterium]
MFLFDLARELHMTVGDLLGRVTMGELALWAAYYAADAARRERWRMEAEVYGAAQAGLGELLHARR